MKLSVRTLGSFVFAFLLLALGAWNAPAANAQMLVNIFQNGADVNIVATGNLNLTGLTPLGTGSGASFITPSQPIVLIGANSASYSVYTGVSGTSSLGPGFSTNATSGSGDRFGFASNSTHQIAVPVGYVSGTPINGSAVFANQTLSSLGVTPGTYNFTLPSSSITVLVGVAPGAVPEPGSLALLTGMTLTGAAFLRRRKQT